MNEVLPLSSVGGLRCNLMSCTSRGWMGSEGKNARAGARMLRRRHTCIGRGQIQPQNHLPIKTGNPVRNVAIVVWKQFFNADHNTILTRMLFQSRIKTSQKERHPLGNRDDRMVATYFVGFELRRENYENKRCSLNSFLARNKEEYYYTWSLD